MEKTKVRSSMFLCGLLRIELGEDADNGHITEYKALYHVSSLVLSTETSN